MKNRGVPRDIRVQCNKGETRNQSGGSSNCPNWRRKPRPLNKDGSNFRDGRSISIRLRDARAGGRCSGKAGANGSTRISRVSIDVSNGRDVSGRGHANGMFPYASVHATRCICTGVAAMYRRPPLPCIWMRIITKVMSASGILHPGRARTCNVFSRIRGPAKVQRPFICNVS